MYNVAKSFVPRIFAELVLQRTISKVHSLRILLDYIDLNVE